MNDIIDPLHVLTKDEFRDVCRKLRPDISDDEFDDSWEQFQQMKALKKLN